MTHFGTSAKYIDALEEDRRWCRARTTTLAALRTMLSTGSPLAPESFDYVYQCVKDDLCLSSISGGTDIVSCFALGLPDAAGVARRDAVPRPRAWRWTCSTTTASRSRRRRASWSARAPFPVDADRILERSPTARKYRAAYFERFPGRLVPRRLRRAHRARRHDHLRPLRRDAESRRRAHRHRRDLPAGRAAATRSSRAWSSARTGRPARSATCASCCSCACATASRSTSALIERIKQHIRANTTPRHVPAKVVQVTDIPRTKSGKIVELAVRNVVHGLPVQEHRGARQSRGARAVSQSPRAQELMRARIARIRC